MATSLCPTCAICIFRMGKGGKSAKGGKGGKSNDGGDSGGGKLKNCNHVKCRHILCEKHSRITECWKKMCENFLDQGDRVPPAFFGKLAEEYSECPSKKRGGDLGWFPRGKMEGRFQEQAFNIEIGGVCQPFKGGNGYHIIMCEGRKA